MGGSRLTLAGTTDVTQLYSVCSSSSSRQAQACPPHGNGQGSKERRPVNSPFPVEHTIGQSNSHGQALVTQEGPTRLHGQGRG